MATIQLNPVPNANSWPNGDQANISPTSATAGLMPTSTINQQPSIYTPLYPTRKVGPDGFPRRTLCDFPPTCEVELLMETTKMDMMPVSSIFPIQFQNTLPDHHVSILASIATKDLIVVSGVATDGEVYYALRLTEDVATAYYKYTQCVSAFTHVLSEIIYKLCFLVSRSKIPAPGFTRQQWNRLMHAVNGNIDNGYVYLPLASIDKVKTMVPPACDPTNPAYESGPQPIEFGMDKFAFFAAYTLYLKQQMLPPAAYLAQNAWNLYVTNLPTTQMSQMSLMPQEPDFDWYSSSESFEALKKAGLYSYTVEEECLSSPNKPMWKITIEIRPVRGPSHTSTVTARDKATAKKVCHAILLSKLLGWSYEAKLNALMLSGDIETNPGPTQAIGRTLASPATFSNSHVTLITNAVLGADTSSVSLNMTVYKPGDVLGDLGNFGFLVYWKRLATLPDLSVPTSGTPVQYDDKDYVVVFHESIDISPSPPTPDVNNVGPLVTTGVTASPYLGSLNRCLCANFFNGTFQETNFSVSWILTKIPSITPGLDLTRFGVEPNPGPVYPFQLIAAGASSFDWMIANALKTNEAHEDTVYYQALLDLLEYISPNLAAPFVKLDPEQVDSNDSVSSDPELKGGPPAPKTNPRPNRPDPPTPVGSQLPKPPSPPKTPAEIEKSRKDQAAHMQNVAARIAARENTWEKYILWALKQEKLSLDFVSISMPRSKITYSDLVCLELLFSKLNYNDIDTKFTAFWNVFKPANVINQTSDFFAQHELNGTGLKPTYTEEEPTIPKMAAPKYKLKFIRSPTYEELQSVIENVRKKRRPEAKVSSVSASASLGGWLEDLTIFGCVEKNPGPGTTELMQTIMGTGGSFVNPTMTSLLANKSTVKSWRDVVVDKNKRPLESYKLYQALSGADPTSVPPNAQYSPPDIISYNAIDPVAAPAGVSTYEVFNAGLLIPRSTRAGANSDLVDSNQRLAFLAVQQALKPGIKLIRTQLADQVVNISRGEALLALKQNVVLASWYSPVDLFKTFVSQMEGEFCPENFLVRLLLAMYNTQWIEMGRPGNPTANWAQTERFPWAGEAGKWDNSVLASEAEGGSYQAQWNNEFSTVIFNEDCGGNSPVFPFAGGNTGSVTFGISIASLKASVFDANIIFIPPSLLALMPDTVGKAIAMVLMMFCETWGILSLDINTRNINGGALNNQRFVPGTSTVFLPGRRDFGVMMPRSQIGQAPTTAGDAQRFAEYVIKTGPRATTIAANSVLNYASDAGSNAQPLTDFILSWADSITVEDWTAFAKIHQAVFGFTRDDWNYANEAVAVLSSRFNFNICAPPNAAQPLQPHNNSDALVQNIAYMQTIRKLPSDAPNGNFPYNYYPDNAGFALGNSNLADYNKVVSGVAFPEKLPTEADGVIYPTGLFTVGSVFSLKYIAQKHAAMYQLGCAIAQMPIGATAIKINDKATMAFKNWNKLLFSGSSASSRGFSTVQPTPLGRIFAATAQKALAHGDTVALDRSGAPFMSYLLKGGWTDDPQVVKNWTGTTFSNFDVGRPRLLSDALMAFYIESAPQAFALLPPGGGTTESLKGIRIDKGTFFSIPTGGFLGYATNHSTGNLAQKTYPYERWSDTEILDHRIADVVTGRSIMTAALNGPVGLVVLNTGQSKLPGTVWKVWSPPDDYQMPSGSGVTYDLTVRSWQGASDWLPPATVTGSIIFPYFSQINTIKSIIFGAQPSGIYSTILYGAALTPSIDILDDYADVDPLAGYNKANFEDSSKAAFESNSSGVADVRPTAGTDVSEKV